VLQAEQWLMATMVSMDLNPVRDGLVQRAVDWPWSSYAHNAGLQSDALMRSARAGLGSLGNTPFARDAAYVRAVEAGLDADTQAQSAMPLRGWAWAARFH
jgi:putative transposase